MAHMPTNKLTVSIDGAESAPDVSSVAVNAAASSADFVPFSAGAGGGRDYVLALTIAQDSALNSTWDQIWSHAGEDIDVIVRPYGNSAASATQPHYHGTVTVKEPDGTLIGGDYNASSTAVFTVQVEWAFSSKPTRVTT